MVPTSWTTAKAQASITAQLGFVRELSTSELTLLPNAQYPGSAIQRHSQPFHVVEQYGSPLAVLHSTVLGCHSDACVVLEAVQTH